MEKRKALALACVAGIALAARGATRPNILLLMAEDIGCDLPSYGEKGLQTPNLDRLAAEGIRYDRFYTSSPICSPSRTAIMTGMYQTTIGGHHHRSKDSVVPAHVLPITHYLRAAGYVNILGSELVLGRGMKTDLNFDAPRDTLFDVMAKDVREKRKEPFFQQVQLQATHRDAQKPRWEEVRRASANPVDPAAVAVPPYLPDIPEVRLDIANYLDMMQFIDNETGLLIDELRADGLLENTVIIFIGDNGRCQVRGKSYLWEDGIRCPMIIWGKGIEKGVVNSDLVSGIDLSATILALAGIEPPAYMQGQAFLRNDAYQPRDHVFSARDRHDEIMDCSRVVVGRRYKYIRNFMPDIPWDAGMKYYENPLVRPLLPVLRKMRKQGALAPEQAFFFAETKPVEQLYDLEADPWELRNLADNPEFQATKKTLRDELDRWIGSSGDQGLRKGADGEWEPTAAAR